MFPELCLAPASVLSDEAGLRRKELAALARPLDHTAIRAVCAAVERTGVAAGVGWLERADDGRLFNSYLVCLPGGLRWRHRKLYVAGHRHLSGGDRHTVFETPWGVRVGILIGGDNYLVENARAVALLGATLLIAPHRADRPERGGGAGSNAGSDAGHEWFMRSLPVRAADNGTFVVFSSAGAGIDGRDASSRSFIADPSGCVLASTEQCAGKMAAATLDLRLAEASAGRRWMAERRPDLYDVLSAAQGPAASFDSYSGSATARGSVALSFAVVGRGLRRG